MIFRRGSAARHLGLMIRRRIGSALYITGDKGVDVCPTVTPYVNFEECLSEMDAIEKNISRRKSHVKSDRLKETLRFYLEADQTKRCLEEKKTIVSETMSALFAANNIQELEKMKIHNKIIKEDLKNLKSALWPIQERIVSDILGLPNGLHPKTPDSIPFYIEKFGDSEQIQGSESHIDIGRKNDLIIFSNPYNYYLKNEAAIFELEAKFFVSQALRDLNFIQFSNPDFVKSAIVEGVGLDHRNPSDAFILHHNEDTPLNENSRLHLVGGGSLLSFAGYHARNLLNRSSLPLRYYALGRQYKPVPETSTLGLFEVSQSSVVEVFIVTEGDSQAMDVQLEKAISDVVDIYKQIGHPFRVCYRPADSLAAWESLRVSFEMYSPFYKRHFEVGHLSASDDFISKRLQFAYTEGKELRFPKIISGTILSVPRLLGCVLESDTSAPYKRPAAFEKVNLTK